MRGRHSVECFARCEENGRGPRPCAAQAPTVQTERGWQRSLQRRALEPPPSPTNKQAGAGTRRGRACSLAAPPGADAPQPATGRLRGRPHPRSLQAQLRSLDARACAPKHSCCLAVSMATKSVDQGSGKEKMKLKGLLLRYYPPGRGRTSSVLAWVLGSGLERLRGDGGCGNSRGRRGPLEGDPCRGQRAGRFSTGPLAPLVAEHCDSKRLK